MWSNRNIWGSRLYINPPLWFPWIHTLNDWRLIIALGRIVGARIQCCSLNPIGVAAVRAARLSSQACQSKKAGATKSITLA